MKTIGLYLFVLFLLSVSCTQEQDKGEYRLRRLRELTALSSNNILKFTNQDFKQFALTYPRPYDLVIYFNAPSCGLCSELQPQYDYMVDLYYQQGAITAEKNPTFFIKVTYSRQTQSIFQTFKFQTIPNLVVSKPFMAVVSETQKKMYFQKFKWAISHSDGHVTTHKMLQFANQRTGKDIYYKPTLKTMLMTFFGFVIFAVMGVLIYTRLRWLWNHWTVWFVGSILIYITCVSGVVYDIIHDVPFVGRDPKTGQSVIFAGANREQYGAQGLIISVLLCGIGLLFIAIVALPDKFPLGSRNVVCIAALVLIFLLVGALEEGYKAKSWYGPSFAPPQGYQTGPIWKDQGNSF